MSDYTPTTEEVREFIEAADRVIAGMVSGSPAVEAFDRWLAAHDDEVRAGVVTEEPEWEPEYASGPSPQALVRTSRRGDRYAHETAYERRVTPWVPVKQEGAEK